MKRSSIGNTAAWHFPPASTVVAPGTDTPRRQVERHLVRARAPPRRVAAKARGRYRQGCRSHRQGDGGAAGRLPDGHGVQLVGGQDELGGDGRHRVPAKEAVIALPGLELAHRGGCAPTPHRSAARVPRTHLPRTRRSQWSADARVRTPRRPPRTCAANVGVGEAHELNGGGRTRRRGRGPWENGTPADFSGPAQWCARAAA